MNKYISIFIYLVFFPIVTFSQNLHGTVVNATTKEPVPFANVYVSEIHSGTVCNEQGVFSLVKLPKGVYHVSITSIGYKTKTIQFNGNENHIGITINLDPNHIDLEEIVVSVPISKLGSENVMSVEQRKIETLNELAPNSLAEAISTIPGVDQRSTGSGIGKPVIRGLSGNRVVVYAQGIRIENQQWGDEHGLGIGDVGIESIELIKGPSSLLYGSDALGGVLFFVDERYTTQNNIEGFAETKFLSNTNGTYNSAGFKTNYNGFKFNVFGNYVSNADYKIPSKTRVFNTRFNQANFKTSLGYNVKKWTTNFRFSYLKNNFGITEDDSLYSESKRRNMEIPFQIVSNQNYSWENIFYLQNSTLQLILGYTNNSRQEFEDSADTAALDMKLGTTTYNLKWNYSGTENKLNLVLGSQGMFQTNTNFGEESLIPNAQTNDFGGFGLINYQLNKLKLEGGLRYDLRHISTPISATDNQFDHIDTLYQSFNYSLGGLFTFSNATLRMNVSSGFRAPNTSELLSNGVHEGTQQYVLGDVNLKSENANQIDVDFEQTTEHFSWYINPFLNLINNYIFLNPTNSTIGQVKVYEYAQTNAQLYGGEIGFHYHPHAIHWLHLQSDFSSVFGQNSQGDDLPLIPSPKIGTTVKATLDYGKKWVLKDVFLNHVYRFPQNRIGNFETATADYSLFTIGLNSTVKWNSQSFEITAGVKNLLNTKYTDHLSRLKPLGVPNQGINFYIGLKLNLSKG